MTNDVLNQRTIKRLTSSLLLCVKRFCLVSHIFCRSVQPSSSAFSLCTTEHTVDDTTSLSVCLHVSKQLSLSIFFTC